MGYLVIKPSEIDLKYTCTSTYDKPRLYVNGNYIPLLVKNSGSLTVKGNKNTYKVGELSTYTAVGTLNNVSTLTSESYLTRSSTSRTITENVITTVTVQSASGTSQNTWWEDVGTYTDTGKVGLGIWTYTNGETGTDLPGHNGAPSGGHNGGVNGDVLWITETYTRTSRTLASDPVETWTHDSYTMPYNGVSSHYETRTSTYSTIYNTYTSGTKVITTGTTYYTRSSTYGTTNWVITHPGYTTTSSYTTGKVVGYTVTETVFKPYGDGTSNGEWVTTELRGTSIEGYEELTEQVNVPSQEHNVTSELTRSSTSNTSYGTTTTNGTYSVYKTTWV